MATATVITGCGLVPALLMAVLAVEVKQSIALSPVVLGTLLASAYLCAGVGGLLGAKYCERVGWRRAGRIAGMCSLTALLLCAAAQNVAMLFAGMLLAGLAISIGTPGGVLLLTTQIPLERRGRAFGLNSAAMPLATLIAGSALPIAADALGWRATFVVGAIWPATTILASAGSTPRAREPKKESPRSAVSRALRLATVGAALGSLALGAATGFFVLTAVSSGLSRQAAAVTVILGGLGGLCTRLVSGWRLDQVRSSGFAMAGTVLLASVIGYAGLVSGNVPTMAIAGILMFTAGLGWHAAFYLAVARTNVVAPAAATGFAQIGVATGAAFGPLAFGAVAALSGAVAAWSMTAVCALIGGAVLLRAATVT